MDNEKGLDGLPRKAKLNLYLGLVLIVVFSVFYAWAMVYYVPGWLFALNFVSLFALFIWFGRTM